MLVKSIMTKKIISVKPTDSLETVLSKFSKYKISGVPVVNKKNELVGMVTEADVLKTIDVCLPKVTFDTQTSFSLILELVRKPNIEMLKEGKHAKKIVVKEFMHTNVVTIDAHETITKAAELMNTHNVKRLPVLEKGKVVGIISRADIIRALIK